MINKNFEEIKDDICFRLINSAANKEMLENLSHVEVFDLSTIFYYKTGEGFKEGATVDITNDDMRGWGISVEELEQLARGNTARLLPPEFMTIEQVISDIATEESLPSPMEGQPKEKMYVLTNEEKYFGANYFLSAEVMEKVGEELGVDFFIIPSSIHENIIMPEGANVTADNLRSLVADMNETFLEPEEVLSNEVYRYDRKTKELQMTDASERKIDMGSNASKQAEEKIADKTHSVEAKRR